MKQKLNLLSAIMLVGIGIVTDASAQNIQGASTQNYVLKFTNTNGTFPTAGNSLIFDNGSNVSINYAGAGSYKLDVNGDINAGGSSTATTNALRLGTNKILWHNGHVENIFVGVGAGASTTGLYNTAVGYQAMHANKVLLYNTAIGYQALYSSDTMNCTTCGAHASTNTACGYQTLYNSQAYGGTAFGFWAGLKNTTGCSTTAFGEEALRFNTKGDDNVGVGTAALHDNNEGSANTAIGDNAGAGSGTDTAANYSNNCFFGWYAGSAITTGGDSNVFVGHQSGFNNSSASNNTFVGDHSGFKNTTGAGNLFMGLSSGYSNTSGSGNVFLGYQAGYSVTGSNKLYIANSSTSTPLIYGDFSTGNVGIGTTAPSALLDVKGFMRSMAVTTLVSPSAGKGIELVYRADGTYDFGIIQTYDRTGSAYKQLQFSASSFAFNYSNVGIGTTTPGSKLDVNGTSNFNGNMAITGNVTITGSGTVSGTWTWSDQMFKTNIDSMHNALTVIRQLKPKTYYLDTLNYNDCSFSPKKQYGFIAQDVETILPELVSSNIKAAVRDSIGNVVHPALNFKAINYVELIPFLTKGIQEQEQKIDSIKTKTINQDSINTVLKKSIDSLKQGAITAKLKAANQDSSITSLQYQINQLLASINACCASHTSKSMIDNTNSLTAANQTNVELSNKNIVVLDQNVPNPFAEQTVINYFLPENVTRAQIIFLDQSGKLIKAVDLTEKGKGQLNVFANDLTNGVYTYSLIVDGQTMETKKMMKTK